MRLAAGRVGGEGRCLAAEVRPYLELAGCLSSSRVRGGGSGEGEEEKQLLGGGEDSPREPEGPAPLLVCWETPPAPPRTPSVSGGRRSASGTQKCPLPSSYPVSQEQDIRPTVGPTSKAHHHHPASWIVSSSADRQGN